jgi:uncharacterized protein YegL
MNNEFKPAGGVKLPRVFNQLGILVLDGSGSMTDISTGNAPKAKHVESACYELFNRMNGSRVKQNFSFACIKFDNTPTVALNPTAFDFTALMGSNFDPLEGKGGQTYINLALEEAKQVAEDFLNGAQAGSVPHKVLILLLSDGMCFEPEKTLAISTEIKSNPKIEIATVYFGTVGNNDVDAQTLMKEVASDPTRYTTVYDGDALRNFFERSISQSAGINQSDLK